VDELDDPLLVAWLAGLLEGEGSFMAGPPSHPRAPVVVVSMTDFDIVARVARVFRVQPLLLRRRNVRWRDAYEARSRGRRAVEVMGAVRPHMGERRRAQIDRAIACYRPDRRRVLDDAGAMAVLQHLAEGATPREAAERAGISVWSVYDLRLGRSYKHLPRP